MSWDQTLLLYLLVWARLLGLVLILPGMGGNLVPRRLRLGLSLWLAMLVVSCHPQQIAPAAWASAEHYLATMIREVALGWLFACAVLVLIAAGRLAGQMISQVAGLTWFSQVGAAAPEETGPWPRLMELLAVGLFLATEGHRHVLAALLDSYHHVPAESALNPQSFLEVLLQLASQGCDLAVRVSLPIVGALLLANVLVALLARALPQMSMIASGWAANLTVVLLMLVVSLGGISLLYRESVVSALQTIVTSREERMPFGR